MRTLHAQNSKPRLPRRLQQEQQVLDQLSKADVELAFQHLCKPIQESPPQELKHLNELEWFLLGRMLDKLLLEKESARLQ